MRLITDRYFCHFMSLVETLRLLVKNILFRASNVILFKCSDMISVEDNQAMHWRILISLVGIFVDAFHCHAVNFADEVDICLFKKIGQMEYVGFYQNVYLNSRSYNHGIRLIV
jgi:hypothetical protein